MSEKSKKRFDKNKQQIDFSPRDLVCLRKPNRKVGLREKLLPQYSGPWEIVMKTAPNNYQITNHSRKKMDIVNVERLKTFNKRVDEPIDDMEPPQVEFAPEIETMDEQDDRKLETLREIRWLNQSKTAEQEKSTWRRIKRSIEEKLQSSNTSEIEHLDAIEENNDDQSQDDSQDELDLQGEQNKLIAVENNEENSESDSSEINSAKSETMMADSSHFDVKDRLDPENYFIWESRVKGLLKGKDVWINMMDEQEPYKPIQGEANYDALQKKWREWNKQNSIAYNIILNTMTSELVGIYAKHEHAKELWEAVKKDMADKTEELKIKYGSDLTSLKMTKNEKVEEYFDRAESLNQKCAELGKKFETYEFKHYLVEGVRSEFEVTLKAIRANKALTANEIREILRREEEVEMAMVAEEIEIAMVLTEKEKKITNKSDEIEEVSEATDEKSIELLWLLDSGSTSHMTSREDYYSMLDEEEKREIKVAKKENWLNREG
uniref:Integrase p58-like C-terminal domain-containing protein n=1 Tax=Strigamia maritima TaxID=126957 RepID=T1IM04_STRMM